MRWILVLSLACVVGYIVFYSGRSVPPVPPAVPEATVAPTVVPSVAPPAPSPAEGPLALPAAGTASLPIDHPVLKPTMIEAPYVVDGTPRPMPYKFDVEKGSPAQPTKYPVNGQVGERVSPVAAPPK